MALSPADGTRCTCRPGGATISNFYKWSFLGQKAERRLGSGREMSGTREPAQMEPLTAAR